MGGSSKWSVVWAGVQFGVVALFAWAWATGRSTRPFALWFVGAGVAWFVQSGRWRERSAWFAIATLMAVAAAFVLAVVGIVQGI